MRPPQQPQDGNLQHGARSRRPVGEKIVGGGEQPGRQMDERQHQPGQPHSGKHPELESIRTADDDLIGVVAYQMGRANRDQRDGHGQPDERTPAGLSPGPHHQRRDQQSRCPPASSSPAAGLSSSNDERSCRSLLYSSVRTGAKPSPDRKASTPEYLPSSPRVHEEPRESSSRLESASGATSGCGKCILFLVSVK